MEQLPQSCDPPPGQPLPALLAGRYRLERVLGVGGMGVVYRARDLLHEQFGEPRSQVALKVLGEHLAPSQDAHLLLYSEFSLTRYLRHERVVRVFSFEVDTTGEVAFFTMELMSGMTLDQLLLNCPRGVPWQALRPIALGLLEALGYIHRQGVLHGDVKPGNVMLGADGVRLFDFGLAQALGPPLSGLPALSPQRFTAWTPAYVAPELLEGAPLSASSEVYGAACLLYDLALGGRAAQGAGPRPRLAPPRQLPRRCWSALRVALSVDPQRRTITADELQAAMQCEHSVVGRWFADRAR
ncbi:serine/threonine-protein kinase [Pseudomonas gessardii]|uniref:serine/threonine-protein kinase n=1 Tax=Pseudomonas gessardii TaxID=78544 RepID=UPI001472BD86|nr:serine/threonine-protein kinase [Pseudomonas gessardii]NNA88162.1 serine/threonine protein kinase [Pseudomonas gessardii]